MDRPSLDHYTHAVDGTMQGSKLDTLLSGYSHFAFPRTASRESLGDDLDDDLLFSPTSSLRSLQLHDSQRHAFAKSGGSDVRLSQDTTFTSHTHHSGSSNESLYSVRDNASLSAVTLGSLQDSNATIAGHLHKLSHSTTPSPKWTAHYFVLSESGTLYLFPTSTNPSCTPLASLPVTACSGSQDDTNAWILKVQGGAVNTDGVAVKRKWTLQCPDEGTVALWMRSIARVVSSGMEGRGREAAGNPAYPRRTTSTHRFQYESAETSAARNALSPRPSSRSRSMQRSNSIASSTEGGMKPINHEEREAEMRKRHQEYMALQKHAAERFKMEQAARREAVERAKLEAVLAKREQVERERLEVEVALQRAKEEEEKKKQEIAKQKKLAQEQLEASKKLAPVKPMGPMMLAAPGMYYR
ncbi:hypothetical protein HDU98_004603 [Podochytrium sp. JEL0797]|nr:hypothetical protein HDU98_004603 [Podochytrium sp. JEL0797]